MSITERAPSLEAELLKVKAKPSARVSKTTGNHIHGYVIPLYVVSRKNTSARIKLCHFGRPTIRES